ncbi:unnamed protein product [Dibothriocephalus latus]|uniref:Dynein heavy chain C-terminal domain-containing protein n=1 Tax=Dibothriocephalus latus TaxID=60516 RepID=A0A3P7MI37_DIBLA|nr:unnamed protein product [Dibothriocephalus latus]
MRFFQAQEEEEEAGKEGSDEAQKEENKKPASSDTSSKDAVVDAMAVSILGRLPPLFDVTALRKKYMGSEISPTTVVLIQELDRYVYLSPTDRSTVISDRGPPRDARHGGAGTLTCA